MIIIAVLVVRREGENVCSSHYARALYIVTCSVLRRYSLSVCLSLVYDASCCCFLLLLLVVGSMMMMMVVVVVGGGCGGGTTYE